MRVLILLCASNNAAFNAGLLCGCSKLWLINANTSGRFESPKTLVASILVNSSELLKSKRAFSCAKRALTASLFSLR